MFAKLHQTTISYYIVHIITVVSFESLINVLKIDLFFLFVILTVLSALLSASPGLECLWRENVLYAAEKDDVLDMDGMARS